MLRSSKAMDKPSPSLRYSSINPLALGMLAFCSVDIAGLGSIFNTWVRWGVLFALAGHVALSPSRRRHMGGAQGVMILLLTGWFLSTTLWSEVPRLSFLKGLAYGLVAAVFFSLGAEAASVRRTRGLSIVVLGPALAASFAVATGGILSSPFVGGASLRLYRGATANPNFMGLLLLMGLPLLLHCTARRLPHRTATFRNRRNFAVAIWLGLLILTRSRASIVAAGLMLAIARGGGSSLRRSRTIGFALVLVAAFGILNLFDAQQPIERLILKGEAAASGDLLMSRRSVWADSVLASREGGVFGGGLGVSIGHYDYDDGASAASYGREKGNSTLAIIEEVGVVGLILFSAQILTVLHAAITILRRLTCPLDVAMTIRLSLGLFLALVTNAQFEGWMVAPGAAAVPVYWATSGYIITLAKIGGSEIGKSPQPA